MTVAWFKDNWQLIDGDARFQPGVRLQKTLYDMLSIGQDKWWVRKLMNKLNPFYSRPGPSDSAKYKMRRYGLGHRALRSIVEFL